jgi:hypothetical protein
MEGGIYLFDLHSGHYHYHIEFASDSILGNLMTSVKNMPSFGIDRLLSMAILWVSYSKRFNAKFRVSFDGKR